MALNGEKLAIGVLLTPPVQLLDLSAVDLFGMLSQEYLRACRLPESLVELGRSVSIHYISPTGQGTLAELSASASLAITCSLSDDFVQPGLLDVLLIPGPAPSLFVGSEVQTFIRGHAACDKTDILTVCTGVYVAGQSGILKDREATGPRGLLGDLREKFPDANWMERRWQRDGRLWTSAGITNGLDMMSAYLRSCCSKELADLVCAMADVGDRGQEYPNSKAAETTWWLWLLIRSWWIRQGGRNKDKKGQ